MAESAPVHRISLSEVRNVAVEAVKSIGDTLEVMSAKALGESTYIELLVIDTACDREPCRVLVAVDRDVDRSDLRDEIAGAVRHSLRP
jgi:hypothetical protein